MWKILNYFKRKKHKNYEDISFHKNIVLSKNQEIDMNEIMNNLFLSKKLYNSLKVKCHPDRFTEINQKRIATEIYQNITKNKTNYQQLLNIKEQAKLKLGIIF